MKLMRTEDAVGQVLCHDITQIIKGVTKDAVFCNWNTSWWKLRDELLLRMEEQNSFQGKKLNYLDGAALRLLDNKE